MLDGILNTDQMQASELYTDQIKPTGSGPNEFSNLNAPLKRKVLCFPTPSDMTPTYTPKSLQLLLFCRSEILDV